MSADPNHIPYVHLLGLIGADATDSRSAPMWNAAWTIGQRMNIPGCGTDAAGTHFIDARVLAELARDPAHSFAAAAYAAWQASQAPAAPAQAAPAPAAPAPVAPAAPAVQPVPQEPSAVDAQNPPKTEDERQKYLAQALGRKETTPDDLPQVGEQNEAAPAEEKPKKKRKRRTKAEIEADKRAAEEAKNGNSDNNAGAAGAGHVSGNGGSEVAGGPAGSGPVAAPNPAAGVPADSVHGNGQQVSAVPAAPAQAPAQAPAAAPTAPAPAGANPTVAQLPSSDQLPSLTEQLIQKGIAVGEELDPAHIGLLKDYLSSELERRKAEEAEAKNRLEVIQTELSAVRSCVRVLTLLGDD